MKLAAPLLCAALLTLPAHAADNLAATDWFKTSGSGVALEKRNGNNHVFFGIGLTPVKKLPAGAVIVAEFPNPADAAHPLEASLTPKAGEEKLSLRSDPVECIVNNSDYTITVKLYTDASRKKLLGTHVQPLALKVPPPAIKELALKECPPGK